MYASVLLVHFLLHQIIFLRQLSGLSNSDIKKVWKSVVWFKSIVGIVLQTRKIQFGLCLVQLVWVQTPNLLEPRQVLSLENMSLPHHEWWGQTGLRDWACALRIHIAGDEQLSPNPCSPNRLGSRAAEDAKYWKGSNAHEVVKTRRQCFAPLLQHFSSSLAIWVDTRHQACLWNAAQHIRISPRGPKWLAAIMALKA